MISSLPVTFELDEMLKELQVHDTLAKESGIVESFLNTSWKKGKSRIAKYLQIHSKKSIDLSLGNFHHFLTNLRKHWLKVSMSLT